MLIATLTMPGFVFATDVTSENPDETQISDIQSGEIAGTAEMQNESPSQEELVSNDPFANENGITGSTNAGLNTLASEVTEASITPLDTITVPGDYTTLQAAIDGAGDGDVIQLAAGTYTGPFTIPTGKSITIKGAGAGSTTITSASGNTFTVNSSSPVYFEDLTIAYTGGIAGRSCILTDDYIAAKVYLKNCVLNTTRRGISTYGGNGTILGGIIIELDNTQIYNTNVSDYDTEAYISQDARGISIFDTGLSSSSVTLKNGSAIMGFGYGINITATGIGTNANGITGTSVSTDGLTVNIIDSAIHSWGCLNVLTAGTVFNITDSTLLGINTDTSASNSFSAISMLNGIYTTGVSEPLSPNVLNITNSTITNYMPDPDAVAGTVYQQLIRIENEGMTIVNLTDATLHDTTGLIASAIYGSGMSADELAEYIFNNVAAENVTVIGADGSAFSLSPLIGPESFTLNKDSVVIYVGEKVTFEMESVLPVYADTTLELPVVANTSIASVNNATGEVTGLVPGVTTIRLTAATANDNNEPTEIEGLNSGGISALDVNMEGQYYIDVSLTVLETPAPTTPTTPITPAATSAASPQTGDSGAPVLWSLILVAAGFGIWGAKRKKHHTSNT